MYLFHCYVCLTCFWVSGLGIRLQALLHYYFSHNVYFSAKAVRFAAMLPLTYVSPDAPLEGSRRVHLGAVGGGAIVGRACAKQRGEVGENKLTSLLQGRGKQACSALRRKGFSDRVSAELRVHGSIVLPHPRATPTLIVSFVVGG